LPEPLDRRDAASEADSPWSPPRPVPRTGAAGFNAGGAWGTSGVPISVVLGVAMAMLVVELVASGRVVVVVAGAVVLVMPPSVVDVVAAAVTGTGRVEVAVVDGADGSTTTTTPCIPRLPWTRQK
jgi:hypothetical protein